MDRGIGDESVPRRPEGDVPSSKAYGSIQPASSSARVGTPIDSINQKKKKGYLKRKKVIQLVECCFLSDVHIQA